MEEHTHSQDWDWEEVLLPTVQNPNLQEELLDGDSSAPPSADIIRSNYFSIPNPKSAIEIAVDSNSTIKEDESVSDIDLTASWMDPDLSPRKRWRNSTSESSDLSAVGQPHSDYSHQNLKCEEGIHVNGFGVEIDNKEEEEEEEEEEEGDEARNSNSIDKEEEDDGVEMKMVAKEEEEKGLKSFAESVAWWRFPMEVIKYFVLRVSPVWSLSVAAVALMGFAIYRRRWLSKIKRKTQAIQLNVTVDDKKVSEFMTRATRLNEAFSVVKRVPIIRPSIPSPGFASWPVVSLR